MNRDYSFERATTRDAGSPGLLRAAESLSEFAQDRAHPGPVETTRVMAGAPDEPRDFRREVAEELADARNYLVWELQREGRPVAGVRHALTLVVAAWAALGFVPTPPTPASHEAPEVPLGANPSGPVPPGHSPALDARTRTAPHGDPLR